MILKVILAFGLSIHRNLEEGQQMLRTTHLMIVAMSIFGLIGCSEDPTQFPSNSNDYETTNREVGCDSKLSDSRKDDLWDLKYKNHWMIWTGSVFIADLKESSLQMDGAGKENLEIIFADGHSGYDLEKGETATVKFVMKSKGGCSEPYGGEYARIVRKTYKNGQLAYKGDYNKNAKKEGPWIRYRKNGQLWYKGTFKNGMEEGPWVVYHENGTANPKWTGTFKNGEKIK